MKVRKIALRAEESLFITLKEIAYCLAPSLTKCYTICKKKAPEDWFDFLQVTPKRDRKLLTMLYDPLKISTLVSLETGISEDGKKLFWSSFHPIVSLIILRAWEYEGKLSLLIVEAYLKERSEEGGPSISILNGEIERKKRSYEKNISYGIFGFDPRGSFWPWKGLTSRTYVRNCSRSPSLVSCKSRASAIANPFKRQICVIGTRRQGQIFGFFDRLCHSTRWQTGVIIRDRERGFQDAIESSSIQICRISRTQWAKSWENFPDWLKWKGGSILCIYA